VLPSILAGVYAAAGVTLLPFYPPHTAPVLATLTAALMWRAPRWGVALALAAPVFPLGNVALALALLYAAVAVLWLLLFRGEPERAFLPVLGPLLGPLAPVALPLAFVTTRSFVRRGLGAAMGVALASAVAAVRAGPVGLGIPGARDAVAVAGVLLDAAPHALAYEAAVVAILAAGLPWAVRRGRVLARRAAEAAT